MSYMLKKLVDSTLHGTYELEEDKEEVEIAVLGVGGDEILSCLLFTPVGRLVSHHLVIVLSVGSLSKHSKPDPPLYVVLNDIGF